MFRPSRSFFWVHWDTFFDKIREKTFDTVTVSVLSKILTIFMFFFKFFFFSLNLFSIESTEIFILSYELHLSVLLEEKRFNTWRHFQPMRLFCTSKKFFLIIFLLKRIRVFKYLFGRDFHLQFSFLFSCLSIVLSAFENNLLQVFIWVVYAETYFPHRFYRSLCVKGKDFLFLLHIATFPTCRWFQKYKIPLPVINKKNFYWFFFTLLIYKLVAINNKIGKY